MPLTLRSNGSSSANIITSQWFNDFYNLLTGSMQDQEVTLKNNLALNAIGAGPSVAPTLALAAGTGLGIGVYTYVYTFFSPDGESLASPAGNITTTSGNQQVTVSAVATGPTGTTGRKVYRTAVGGGTVYKLAKTISDNTTTSFVDSLADGSLGATAPVSSTFGGSLVMKDSGGTTRLTLSNDGLIIPSGNATTVNGSVSGSVTFSTPIWGPAFKIGLISMANYQNANTVLFTFPSTFARGVYISGDETSVTPANFWQINGSNVTTTVITGLASGGGSSTTVTSFHQNSIGTIATTIGSLLIGNTAGLTYNSAIFFVGV